MIKDVFKFKKKSWHARLMKAVWGYDPQDFRNMCPYFWLSVVNVLCLPIIAIIMLIVAIAMGIKSLIEFSQESIDKACDTKVMKWAAKKTENWWKDEDLIMAVGPHLYSDPFSGESGRSFYSHADKYRKYREFYNALSPEDKKKLWEKYDARLSEIKEASRKAELELWERQAKESEKKKKKEVSRAVRIGRATVVIKTIFKIIIWPILLFFAYMLYLLVVSAVSWDYSWIPSLLYGLYVVFGTLIGLGLLIYAVSVFMSWMSCKLQGVCIPCEARRKKISKFFKFCFGWLSFLKWPFIWVAMFFTSIWKGLVFLKDIFVAFKQNNCPAIEWED